MLYLTNTLTQKKEEFKSLTHAKIAMYVCGITPYDYSHIGHGRCYVTFDLLYRFLTFSGYQVEYARNFTDIDDKILKRAQQEFGDKNKYMQISQRYMDAYTQDMEQLNCLTPTYQPTVTGTIPQIIDFVQRLVQQGVAYELDGSVYFRVTSFKNYGALSKQTICDLKAGARVDVDETKLDALDFALWKKDDEVGFDSPWGKGRPGWHIECSAMAQDICKRGLDIHAGGMDLMFPHHENEIAQSESLYPAPFARYWLHNAFVRINKEKMSKSLGNFFTLREIFEKFDPMVIRFYFLKHHYRNPLDFSFDDLQAAQSAYERIVKFFSDVIAPESLELSLVKNNEFVQPLVAALQDDLNTSELFGALFSSMPRLHDDLVSKSLVKYFMIQVLGLRLTPIAHQQVVITAEIETLLAQREQARKEKNWALSDKIRDQLSELGYQVHDKKLK